jgi:hypothetical protein
MSFQSQSNTTQHQQTNFNSLTFSSIDSHFENNLKKTIYHTFYINFIDYTATSINTMLKTAKTSVGKKSKKEDLPAAGLEPTMFSLLD